MLADTADATRDSPLEGARKKPGLIVAFSGSRAMSLVVPVGERAVVIGRAGEWGAMLPDERLSRSHFSVSHSDDGWVVRDLGSRNGTFVDGRPIDGALVAVSPRTIRAADTLVIPCDDLSGFRGVVAEGGLVVGWRMQNAFAAVDRAAAASATLLLSGESGTGKEVAARRFHAKGSNAAGPFVALNCATIPQGLAERLLFGATRGAYSGADADAAGHVRAADGGVLFLDEIGELDPGVQAKLLRVIETQEYVALGATRPTRIAIRVCAATHIQLRRAVAEGRFRSDLYHRISPPEVVLPPLRARLDEIPHHVAREVGLTAPGLSAHVRLVEACILLPWPGNVRELSRHLRDAASLAVAERARRVRPEHLASTAGQALASAQDPDVGAAPPPETRRPYVNRAQQLTRDLVLRALTEHAGSVSGAARSLGLQRTQLYREIERHAIARPSRRR